ncbi:MAG: MMPL family transporter, partial [Clostridia bacterium]
MDRLAKFIVKHRIFFMVFFLALLIICACLIPQVKINYNLTNYMPKESEFANASDILADEEWDNEVITAMLKGVEKSDQQKVVDKLSKIDNIDSVQISKYSAEQKAVLLNITLKADLSNTQLKTCIGQLRDNGTGYETFLSGMSINDMFIQDTTDSETGKIMLFLIPIVLLVLIFTSKSWLEPIICLGIMGVAIAISMGTNIIFTGGVSFITQSILAALTMAISMDYSIFMLHAFRDECNNGVEPTLAVVSAVKKSFTSITVGSLTTIAGFVAMLFMKFALGIDMGWVFAKTILISLLTVLFLMPGVLLLLHKAIVKTEHKNLFPSFKGVGRVAVKGRYVFAIMAVIILIPAVYGQFNNNFIYGFSSMTEAEGSSLYKDNKAITDIFDTGNQMVILYKNDGDLDKESKLLSDLMKYKSNDKTVVKDTSLSYSSVLKQFGLYDGANAFLKGMGKPTLTLTEFDKAIADPESELMKSLALVAGAKQQLLTGANAFLQGAGLQPLTMEQFNLAIADPNSELMVMLNQVVGAKQQMLDGVNAFLGGAGQQPLTMEQFNEAISHPDTGLMLQLK